MAVNSQQNGGSVVSRAGAERLSQADQIGTVASWAGILGLILLGFTLQVAHASVAFQEHLSGALRDRPFGGYGRTSAIITDRRDTHIFRLILLLRRP